MKKSVKVLKVLFVAIMAFTLTGCVKFNATMEISKNGKINYNILYAINKQLLNGEKIITDEEKKNLEDQGFKIEDYTDDSMEGVNLSINNLDINSVSSTDKDVSYDLSGVTDADKDTKIFSVKKGLFKNTYIAKLEFNTSDSDIGNTDNSTDDELAKKDYDYSNDTDGVLDNDEDNSFNEDLLSQYMSNVEMKFTVKLPYKAISNNATGVDNDGKNLTWDLTKSNEFKNVEFQFELYNTTNIIIFVVLGVIVIGVIIFLVLNKKNRGKKEASPISHENVNNTVSNINENINTFPVENNNVVAAASVVDSSNKDLVSNEVSLKNIPDPNLDINNNSTIGSNEDNAGI